jgi:hypothetical protein
MCVRKTPGAAALKAEARTRLERATRPAAACDDRRESIALGSAPTERAQCMPVGRTSLGASSIVQLRMMRRRSELPTVPPPFNVARFAKDSDAQLVVTGSANEPSEDLKSERRLVTRPRMAAVSTDETWAREMKGMLTAVQPLVKLIGMPLDHRAGYLLSWMDGSIDLDMLVEVSTMSREEVLRIVRDLFDSGVVEFR